jgi:hypothetical protein
MVRNFEVMWKQTLNHSVWNYIVLCSVVSNLLNNASSVDVLTASFQNFFYVKIFIIVLGLNTVRALFTDIIVFFP